jgi:hypothetical protein
MKACISSAEHGFASFFELQSLLDSNEDPVLVIVSKYRIVAINTALVKGPGFY